jgi:hypothetical protein
LHILAACINFAFAQPYYTMISSLCLLHNPIKLTGVSAGVPQKGEKHPGKRGKAPVVLVYFFSIFVRLPVLWESSFPTLS